MTASLPGSSSASTRMASPPAMPPPVLISTASLVASKVVGEAGAVAAGLGQFEAVRPRSDPPEAQPDAALGPDIGRQERITGSRKGRREHSRVPGDEATPPIFRVPVCRARASTKRPAQISGSACLCGAQPAAARKRSTSSRRGAPARPPKRVHLMAAAAEAKRIAAALALSLRQRQREGAMPDIAGAERIDRLDREGRQMGDLAVLDEKHALLAERDREPCRQAPAPILARPRRGSLLARDLAQRLRAEGDMACGGDQIGMGRLAVAVEHAGNAGRRGRAQARRARPRPSAYRRAPRPRPSGKASGSQPVSSGMAGSE